MHFIFVSSTIPFLDVSTHGVNYAESLGVPTEFLHRRVLISSTPLALTTEKLLQWVLAKPLTEKHGDSRNGKYVLHQVHKRRNCEVVTITCTQGIACITIDFNPMECFLGNHHHFLCLVLKTSSCGNALFPLVKIWQEFFLKPLKYCKHNKHRNLKANTITSTYTHSSSHFTSSFSTTYLYAEIICRTVWILENLPL